MMCVTSIFVNIMKRYNHMILKNKVKLHEIIWTRELILYRLFKLNRLPVDSKFANVFRNNDYNLK